MWRHRAGYGRLLVVVKVGLADESGKIVTRLFNDLSQPSLSTFVDRVETLTDGDLEHSQVCVCPQQPFVRELQFATHAL